jgi:hypothetical protein
MADRCLGDAFGGAQEPGILGRPIELGQARQDHALVVGPRGFVVIAAARVDAVVDQVALVDHPAALEPRPFGCGPAQNVPSRGQDPER